jgi:antitoxin CptB
VTANARISRLRWRCRRGMKELDVLLENFIRDHESRLAGGEWPEFESLLETEDDRLWEWLRNPASGRVGPYSDLLESIRGDNG